MRLCPYYPALILRTLGRSYFYLGRYEEAIATLKQLDDRSRKGDCPTWWAPLHLAPVYVELGREEEARALVAEVLKINPKYSLETVKKESLFKDPAHLQRCLDALSKVGMK